MQKQISVKVCAYMYALFLLHGILKCIFLLLRLQTWWVLFESANNDITDNVSKYVLHYSMCVFNDDTCIIVSFNVH